MEPKYVKADSGNLPDIDALMVALFFKDNPDYYVAELRNVKTAVASGMFAEAQVDSFAAIMRKRCASLMRRLRGSPNSILGVFMERENGPMLNRWQGLNALAV